MKTIKTNIESELIIKNSRFITLLIKITTVEEIPGLLEDIKLKYPKATHYCYAYITEDYKKSSDDGEPGGTAGMPMLNVLEKEEMTNVLAVTIRYFGGIKLGAGGLVRAYSKSVREALLISQKEELEKGYQVEIIIPYDAQKDLDYLLKDYQILTKTYQEEVTYLINIPIEKINILKNYSYQILKAYYIEKVHK